MRVIVKELLQRGDNLQQRITDERKREEIKDKNSSCYRQKHNAQGNRAKNYNIPACVFFFSCTGKIYCS